ncbi:MAG: AbrB/MazE/SpoVT family DNA-binding domain-containing protein [Steroidobacteraceae bacterium]
MITSKLTSKAQTTIPQPVRAALGLKEGDELLYQIDGKRVILSRQQPGTAADDPFTTFDEWRSAADARAYDDL